MPLSWRRQHGPAAGVVAGAICCPRPGHGSGCGAPARRVGAAGAACPCRRPSCPDEQVPCQRLLAPIPCLHEWPRLNRWRPCILLSSVMTSADPTVDLLHGFDSLPWTLYMYRLLLFVICLRSNVGTTWRFCVTNAVPTALS